RVHPPSEAPGGDTGSFARFGPVPVFPHRRNALPAAASRYVTASSLAPACMPRFRLGQHAGPQAEDRTAPSFSLTPGPACGLVPRHGDAFPTHRSSAIRFPVEETGMTKTAAECTTMAEIRENIDRVDEALMALFSER